MATARVGALRYDITARAVGVQNATNIVVESLRQQRRAITSLRNQMRNLRRDAATTVERQRTLYTGLRQVPTGANSPIVTLTSQYRTLNTQINNSVSAISKQNVALSGLRGVSGILSGGGVAQNLAGVVGSINPLAGAGLTAAISAIALFRNRAEEARKEAARLKEEMRLVNRLGRGMNTVFKGLVVAGVILGIVNAVGRMVRAFTGAVDSVTNMENRLRLVARAGQSAEGVLSRLRDLAEGSRTSVETATDLYFRLAQALGEEVPTDELEQLTNTILQTVQLSGVSAQSAQAALTQLGQGLASGTLRGQELNSVLEQVPRLARAIAEGSGIAFGQLRELAAQGELTPEIIRRALLQESDAINQEFQTTVGTFEQAGVRLGDNFDRFLASFNDVIPIANGLRNTVNGIATVFEFMADTLDRIANFSFSESFDSFIEFFAGRGEANAQQQFFDEARERLIEERRALETITNERERALAVLEKETVELRRQGRERDKIILQLREQFPTRQVNPDFEIGALNFSPSDFERLADALNNLNRSIATQEKVYDEASEAAEDLNRQYEEMGTNIQNLERQIPQNQIPLPTEDLGVLEDNFVGASFNISREWDNTVDDIDRGNSRLASSFRQLPETIAASFGDVNRQLQTLQQIGDIRVSGEFFTELESRAQQSADRIQGSFSSIDFRANQDAFVRVSGAGGQSNIQEAIELSRRAREELTALYAEHQSSLASLATFQNQLGVISDVWSETGFYDEDAAREVQNSIYRMNEGLEDLVRSYDILVDATQPVQDALDANDMESLAQATRDLESVLSSAGPAVRGFWSDFANNRDIVDIEDIIGRITYEDLPGMLSEIQDLQNALADSGDKGSESYKRMQDRLEDLRQELKTVDDFINSLEFGAAGYLEGDFQELIEGLGFSGDIPALDFIQGLERLRELRFDRSFEDLGRGIRIIGDQASDSADKVDRLVGASANIDFRNNQQFFRRVSGGAEQPAPSQFGLSDEELAKFEAYQYYLENIANSTDDVTAATENLGNQGETTLADLNDSIQRLSESFDNRLASSIADVVIGVRSFQDAFRNVAQFVIRRLIEMSLEAASFGSIFQSIGGAFGGLFGGRPASSPLGGAQHGWPCVARSSRPRG